MAFLNDRMGLCAAGRRFLRTKLNRIIVLLIVFLVLLQYKTLSSLVNSPVTVSCLSASAVSDI